MGYYIPLIEVQIQLLYLDLEQMQGLLIILM